ncbi:precorrin-3B C(17)-methyltransferase [Salinarimonas ramus]|uniref:Tetrapyrrole methylase domain-containing protein n=1 Tax=Salinarimonas ramus TaxID=690164 RepID=A0A917QL91_9HYPH|nr:precorrin-3B C(17)-methyltransferase [Salinarimonas ramus]GGK55367.1 hypothetical protein GCM10011322_47530 [Salinarimonas ramus]
MVETRGRLTIVGLGPGDPDWITPAARRALDEASDVVGYGPYVARIPDRPGLTKHASDNRVELDRSRHALTLAAQGRRVAVVSGGDPGVFAMAAAIFEAVEAGDPAWRALDIRVEPGISAMLAAAARLGAPLGGDFCALSLSDNLKPWDVVERRLRLALEADFAVCLYNPISKARPWQLGRAFEIVREVRAPEHLVALARAVGRPDEGLAIRSVAQVRAEEADMATLVIIGASTTRLIPRPGDARPWMLTPRSYGAGA